MKFKKMILILFSGMAVIFTSCGSTLIEMQSAEIDGKHCIIWEDRTYQPFCVVSKNDCGKRIGIVDGDKQNIVSEYKDYLTDKWIANYLTVDGGAMLYKEINVTEIPDGLEAEYQ